MYKCYIYFCQEKETQVFAPIVSVSPQAFETSLHTCIVHSRAALGGQCQGRGLSSWRRAPAPGWAPPLILA